MPITSLPTPPSRSDPTNFATQADAFLGALPTFQAEANVLQTDVNSKQTLAAASQTAANTSAVNAAASALAAANSAAVSIWVSGTTYAIGDARFSPANFLTYRRKTAGAGTTDPSADSTNWQLITQVEVPYVISTATNASANSVYIVTANLTLTLPASPLVGDSIRVINLSTSNTITIARNTKNIMSLAEDLIVDLFIAPITLMYVDVTRGWVLI